MPEDLNKAAIMTEHFSKFGQVVKAVPNLKKGTCLIKFAHHSEAKLAKSKGKFVSEELVIGHIYYSQASPSRTKRKVDSVEAEELAAMGMGAAGFDSDVFGSTESRIKPAEKVFSLTKSLQPAQKPAAQKPAPARTVHDASYDQANQDSAEYFTDSNEEDQRVMMVSASDPSDQESNDVPTENPSSLANHSIVSDIHNDSGKWRPSTNDVEFIQEDYFDDAGDHNYHIVEPMFEHGEDSDEDDDEDYIYPGCDHQSSLLRKIRRGKKEKGRGSPKRFKNCGVCAPCVSMASFKRYFIIKYS